MGTNKYDRLVGQLDQVKAALLWLATLDTSRLSDDDFEHVVSTLNEFFDALHAARARLRNAEAAS